MASVTSRLVSFCKHPSDDLVTDALALGVITGPAFAALWAALHSSNWKVEATAIVLGGPALGCAVLYIAARALLAIMEARS